MAVRMSQSETSGFKLLQEDNMEDRPCAAVKKFVSSVLDRKDMKDAEVASSFRNLMEYRDSTSSPSACSVATSASQLDADRLNSPPSPPSPGAPAPMDDQRLPNELLDEICEDIGMKEGMELDFVEFLMEQDTNPQAYMTQEAINSAAGSTISTPTGSASGGSNSGSASGSHVSNHTNNHNNNNNNNKVMNDSNHHHEGSKTLTLLNPPSTTATPNFLFRPNFSDSDWINQLPSPLIQSSSGQSSGTTTVISSENTSPANKRIHLSISTDTSPNKGRCHTPPGFNQQNGPPVPGYMPANPYSYSNGPNSQGLFKMPASGPPMAKRSHSYPQGAPASSPVHSTHSSSSQGSTSSSTNHPGLQKPQEFSTNPPSSCQVSDASDQEDSGSGGSSRGKPGKVPCVSPKPIMPNNSCDFVKPGSPATGQGQCQNQSHYNPMTNREGGVFQRVSKQPPPPNVNVKSMQQQQHHQQQQHPHHNQHQRWMGPSKQVPGGFYNKPMYPNNGPPFQHPHGHHPHPHSHPHQVPPHHYPPGHPHGPPMPPGPHTAPVRTPVDSPLDQGYFSNESAGNCSNGSAPSPAFTSSSMSSFSSISTMMPADQQQHIKGMKQQQRPQEQQQQQETGLPKGQKSVHFADMPDGSPPAYSQNQGSNSVDIKPGFGPASAGQPSDCAFEMDSSGQPKTGQSGKILPRFNHNMKSGVAPYTVPNSQAQVMGPPGYDFNNRSSCAMGESPSPGDPMGHEYMGKPGHMNGGSGPGFYMDGNQNMMRMDSMHEYGSQPPQQPPPLMPASDFNGPSSQSGYSHEQFSTIQQHQQQQQQQNQHQPPPPSSHSHPQSQPQPPQSQSSNEPVNSMQPPQAHMQQPHSISMQHQNPHQQFSSCSHNANMGPGVHQTNMQISGSANSSFQMPLAMSTPLANRNGPSSRMMSGPHMGGAYGPQMCPPSYDSSYPPGGHPEGMYGPQPAHTGPAMMGPHPGQSVHRGWGPPSDDLQVQVGGMHPAPSPMKGGMGPGPHQGLPHMQPSPTPACAAPMGHGPPMSDMNVMASGVHMNSANGPAPHHMGGPPSGPHPEYGPCMGMNCTTCKMAASGPPPPSGHPHPHIGPCAGPNCHSCKMNPQPPTGPPGPPMPPHMGPCTGPNCTACKMNPAARPEILSTRQKFIRHLIMDEGNSAYRSHPLFPLLRDLVIAEMNFDNPRFHYQQLLSLLPNDFEKLLQNFLHRNPPSGHYQSNQAVESVIMDSLRLAHSNLVDKIRHRQELEKMKANSSTSLRSMEEFCQKFDHSVTGPMSRPGVPNGVGGMGMGHHHPMAAYHEGGYIPANMGPMGQFRMKDGPDMIGEATLITAASPQANKTESKKHPSLPKEAVAMMMEWLRNHKDNPYPNDDEKAMLIKQTGLSINQINYWFTNARRRILPKWAQCKT